jgi:hypothetical protein
MAKFLVVHPAGKQLTIEATTPVAKAVKANHTVDAYWVRSWYVREEGKLYCEWDAKDAESIRKVMAKATPDFPVEGIYKLDVVARSCHYAPCGCYPKRIFDIRGE